jgi:hypothetical protein
MHVETRREIINVVGIFVAKHRKYGNREKCYEKLSGKIFTKKVVDGGGGGGGGGGDLKCCDPESFLAPPGFLFPPPLTRHPGYASESVIHMMVWRPGKLQSHKIEVVCLIYTVLLKL